LRKKLIALFVLLISLGLSSCGDVKTYDDLYLEYQSHLTANEEVYNQSIDFFNHVSVEIVKSVVLVEKTVLANNQKTSGSGVIFYQDSSYYYVLTNNHIVYVNSQNLKEYTITDYKGIEHDANLVLNDPDYDLAIMRFSKGNSILKVIDLATGNPAIFDDITIIGYPSFQINAITMGNVVQYTSVSIDDVDTEIINVEFDVLVSDTPVKSGSSGSMVINHDFELVGLVYAGKFSDYKFTSDFALIIPLEKIKEYFLLHEFNMIEVQS